MNDEVKYSFIPKLIGGLLAIALFIYLVSNIIRVNKFPNIGSFFASSTVIQNEVASSTESNTSTDTSKIDPRQLPDSQYDTVTVSAPYGAISALVSNNPEKRQIGLSYRRVLPSGTGMMFIFPTPDNYAFWMKDMNFPLDIVWIRSDKKVIGISSNIATSTYPESINPPSNIQFVLELNAGEAVKYGIATDTVLKF